MFYAIIRINLQFDVARFEEIVTTKRVTQGTCIAFADSLRQLKEAAMKLIPMPSSTFIACTVETKKSPLHINNYIDPNNLIRNINFEWTDCANELILPVKSPGLKKELYVKSHWILNEATSRFYGKSSKDHSSGFIDNLELKECLEEGNDFCSGDILYQGLKYYHQPRVFDCGDASMQMLIDYHLFKCNELKYNYFSQQREELKINYDNRTIKPFSGKTFEELKSYSDFLNSSNVKEHIKQVLPGHLTYYLYRYGPIIVRTNEIGGHFVVVKGMVDDKVLIDDPWAGANIFVKFDDFNKKWDGRIVYFTAGYSKYLEKLNEQKNEFTPRL